MNIYIKNMVCVRCKMAVQTVLENLDIAYREIGLGKVVIVHELNTEQLLKLNEGLSYYKLELMDNKKKILAERVKTVIIERLHCSNDDILLKFSEHLSKTLHYDYTYLSNVFSEEEGTTIERFYIENRVERVKELLAYESISIKEIAYQLNYSSVSHLCVQFKKVTGQTPSVFKKLSQTEGLGEIKENITNRSEPS